MGVIERNSVLEWRLFHCLITMPFNAVWEVCWQGVLQYSVTGEPSAMSKVIDLADYRDITPKDEEIRMPEDGFVTLGLSLCGENATQDDLVIAHKWFSLAALRGSQQARVHRLGLSGRLNGEQIARAQSELRAFARSRG